MAVPTGTPLITAMTRLPAWAVPEIVKLCAVVTRSVLLLPVSGPMPVTFGAGGFWVSIVIVMGGEAGLAVPATSVAVAGTLSVPSGGNRGIPRWAGWRPRPRRAGRRRSAANRPARRPAR